MRRGVVPAVLLLAACLASIGHAAPNNKKAAKTIAHSIGAPNAGRLENGVHLDAKPYIRYVGSYWGDAHWGVKELVDAIDRAAREVHKRYPDAVLGVGQLSRKDGGEIDRHHSHESGRDADLAFYLVDQSGKPVALDAFHSIRADGRVGADPRLKFDDGRNFALVSALVSDPHAHVTHIFVATWLRTRLLAYGARVGASPALRARIAETLMQPRHALPHDDHFHVRVACPSSSSGCIETALTASLKKMVMPKVKAVRHVTKAPGKRLVRARVTGKDVVTWATPAFDVEPSTSE
jgi:penicillin-insensitive murein endopeptidase